MKFHKTRSTTGESKVEIQMTPMLDMIFQLLIFFILTFKPVIDEGQFGVNMSSLPGGSVAMPTMVPGMGNEDESPPQDIQFIPPYRVRLVAASDGSLAPGGIVVGEDRRLPSMEQLRFELNKNFGGFAEDVEVIIVADPALHYQHILQAVNAISHARISKISFGTPPSAEPAVGEGSL